MFKRFLLLASFFSFSIGINCQSTSKDLIKNLKTGATVVRLYMNKPKADLLNKSINDPLITPEEKEKLKKSLNLHLQDREAYKLRTISAFNQGYTFSKLYFINDFDIKKLLSGEKTNIFLNNNGEVDPNIVMTEDFYLILGRRNSDETWSFINPSGDDFPTDFPVTYNKSFFGFMMKMFRRDSSYDFVVGLDKKLHDFYLKKK